MNSSIKVTRYSKDRVNSEYYEVTLLIIIRDTCIPLSLCVSYLLNESQWVDRSHILVLNLVDGVPLPYHKPSFHTPLTHLLQSVGLPCLWSWLISGPFLTVRLLSPTVPPPLISNTLILRRWSNLISLLLCKASEFLRSSIITIIIM